MFYNHLGLEDQNKLILLTTIRLQFLLCVEVFNLSSTYYLFISLTTLAIDASNSAGCIFCGSLFTDFTYFTTRSIFGYQCITFIIINL